MVVRFERFHPLLTFIYYAGALALFVLMLHPLFLLLAYLLIILTHIWEDRGRALGRWFVFILTSGIFIFLLNPLFNERGRHVLFVIHQHRFTVEAFTYGMMSALSIMGIIALFVSYNEVMTPNKIQFLFAKFLPQFAVLLMLTLRFIPLMKRRAEEMVAIQASKGISAKYGRLTDRLKIGMLYIQVLLVFSIEEAIQTADSMKTRGYGQGKRSIYEHFSFKKKDWFSMFFLVGLLIVLSYGRYLGFGYLQVYPLLESWHLTLTDGFLLFLEFLYIGFPLIVNIGGAVRWHLSS